VSAEGVAHSLRRVGIDSDASLPGSTSSRRPARGHSQESNRPSHCLSRTGQGLQEFRLQIRHVRGGDPPHSISVLSTLSTNSCQPLPGVLQGGPQDPEHSACRRTGRAMADPAAAGYRTPRAGPILNLII